MILVYNLNHTYVFIVSGIWVAAYWGIAVHSTYDMFSKHK